MIQNYYLQFEKGYWWTATENSSIDAWDRYMQFGNSAVGRFYGPKELGLSVRCVKN